MAQVHIHLDGVEMIRQKRTSEGTFGKKKGEGEGLADEKTIVNDGVIVIKRRKRRQ